MTYDPNDRRPPRERDGLSGGMMAFLVVAAILFIGAMFMVVTSGDRTNTASIPSPGTSQTAPATTGQGGVQSKMPEQPKQP